LAKSRKQAGKGGACTGKEIKAFLSVFHVPPCEAFLAKRTSAGVAKREIPPVNEKSPS
jgi:hypothetical protein